MHRILYIILFITSLGRVCLSQARFDAHFVIGYWSDGGPSYKDPVLHFGRDTVSIDYQKLRIGFDFSSSNISDRNGNLLFYFNGCDLANFRHEIIENGTGFNPGQIATRNCPGNNGYTTGHQSFLTLPMDEIDKEFIIFHNTLDYIVEKDTIIFYGIARYSIVDMQANGGRGMVTIKNQNYIQDTTVGPGNVTAIRHANNRDWWIFVLDNQGSNTYYRILLSNGDVTYQGLQEIGLPWLRIGGGQAGFSSDGRKYFRYSGYDGLNVMDFDRETGLFSNYRNLPTSQVGLFNGASFSPNGRFIYLGNGPSLVQIDTDDDVLVADTVAIWDGKESDWGQPAWFGYMQTGPDCRIYMTTGFCIPFLHVIMEPDKKGIECDVRQHMIELEVPTCNLPYFPNYRLGTPYEYCNPDIVVLSSTEDIPVSVTKPTKLSIYPNPATDKVKIFGSDISSITFYNMQGNKVLHLDLNGVAEQEIDISALPPTVYLVRVTYGKENDNRALKFIKIK